VDDAKWEALVERWEERDRRWEERDARWEEETREHRAFMREMWRRMEEMDIRQQATHEHMIGRMAALTEAVLRVVDRLDGDGDTATTG
jgi:hypothetical protein